MGPFRKRTTQTRSPSSALLPFLGEAPTQIDYRKKGTLILTSLLEDLAKGSLHVQTCAPASRKAMPQGVVSL